MCDHARQDVLLDVLSHRRRRLVLRHLCRTGGVASLTELASVVGDREAEERAGTPARTAIRSAYLSLYHAHIPRLADANLIEYDERSGDVIARDLSEDRRTFLADLLALSDDGSA